MWENCRVTQGSAEQMKGVSIASQASPLGPTPSSPKTTKVSPIPITPEISEYQTQVSSHHNYWNIIHDNKAWQTWVWDV